MLKQIDMTRKAVNGVLRIEIIHISTAYSLPRYSIYPWLIIDLALWLLCNAVLRA